MARQTLSNLARPSRLQRMFRLRSGHAGKPAPFYRRDWISRSAADSCRSAACRRPRAARRHAADATDGARGSGGWAAHAVRCPIQRTAGVAGGDDADRGVRVPVDQPRQPDGATAGRSGCRKTTEGQATSSLDVCFVAGSFSPEKCGCYARSGLRRELRQLRLERDSLSNPRLGLYGKPERCRPDLPVHEREPSLFPARRHGARSDCRRQASMPGCSGRGRPMPLPARAC